MTQHYEEYWKVTLAFTDIHGDKFIHTLKLIRDFIYDNKQKHTEDEFNNDAFTTTIYAQLQNIIQRKSNISKVSVRKAINQFVKLGFISYKMSYYHELTDKFLDAKTNRQRKRIFSEIVYKKSNFASSISKNNPSGHLKFLIDTLTNVGHLTKKDVAALMYTDIDKFKEIGYLTENDLNKQKKEMSEIDFLDRKYNQTAHFKSILKNLHGLKFQDDILYFEEDAERLFPPDYERHGRDVYLHGVFKDGLKDESRQMLGEVKCMVENIAYPILIASHIKPWRKSAELEAYDPSNGLLLTRSMDALFDQGDISFENDGKIILAKTLPQSTHDHLKKLNIYDSFLTSERINYLKYHRRKILKL